MSMKKLAAVDAAYLAGLIDGEGTITLTRKHLNENRQLAITISNTERRLLEFSLVKIGAGKIIRKRCTHSHHTPSYTYAIYNRQALALLEQIFPYLRSYKARRAEIILKHYIELTPRNGKYSYQLKRDREKFDTTVLNIKP